MDSVQKCMLEEPDLSSIEHVWGIMKRGLLFLQSLPQPFPNLRGRVQDVWDNLSQEDIRHLNDRLHARIHACIDVREGYTQY